MPDAANTPPLADGEVDAWVLYMSQVITGRIDVERPAVGAPLAATIADALMVERRRRAALSPADLGYWDSYFANVVTKFNLWDTIPDHLADAALGAATFADAALEEGRRRRRA